MADIAAIKKQLTIKSGAVSRLSKEIKLYNKEVDDLIKKRDGLVEKGAEEWDIKNATKMMEESRKMILDTSTRLDKAAQELGTLVTSAKKIEEAAQLEEFAKAEQVLADVPKAE